MHTRSIESTTVHIWNDNNMSCSSMVRWDARTLDMTHNGQKAVCLDIPLLPYLPSVYLCSIPIQADLVASSQTIAANNCCSHRSWHVRLDRPGRRASARVAAPDGFARPSWSTKKEQSWTKRWRCGGDVCTVTADVPEACEACDT